MPKRNHQSMARLCVTYPLRRGESGKTIWKDDEIDALVGTTSCAAGVFIPTGMRDLEYRLPTPDAQAAAIKLRQRGYQCAVAPEDAENPGLYPI
jgi:hypothetical protein